MLFVHCELCIVNCALLLFSAEEIRRFQEDEAGSPVGQTILEMLQHRTFSQEAIQSFSEKLQEKELQNTPDFFNCPAVYRVDYRPAHHGDDE